jgi:hypothetical protein
MDYAHAGIVGDALAHRRWRATQFASLIGGHAGVVSDSAAAAIVREIFTNKINNLIGITTWNPKQSPTCTRVIGSWSGFAF